MSIPSRPANTPKVTSYHPQCERRKAMRRLPCASKKRRRVVSNAVCGSLTKERRLNFTDSNYVRPAILSAFPLFPNDKATLYKDTR